MKTILIFLAAAVVCANSLHNSKHGASSAMTKSSHHGRTNNATSRHHYSARQEEKAYHKVTPKRARQLLHEAKWVGLASHFSYEGFENYSFTNIQLIADGPKGEPYFYVRKTDQTALDVHPNITGKEHLVSIALSETAVDGHCDKMSFYARDIQCQKLEFLGVVKLIEDPEEYDAAIKTMIKKYPEMSTYDPEKYRVGKMILKGILTQAEDGSAVEIPVKEYEEVDLKS